MNMPKHIADFIAQQDIDPDTVEELVIRWQRYESSMEVTYRTTSKAQDVVIECTGVIVP